MSIVKSVLTKYDYQDRFWSTLFNKSDWTCCTYEPTGTAVRPMPMAPGAGNVFFTINALAPDSSRSDANIIAHRTFLFEFDSMPMDEQRKLITNFPVPLTAAVFSGNKSIHFFVTLQRPVTADEYRSLWKRIADLLPEGVDKSTKNPSRLARIPGAMRNGVEQELLYLGQAVNNELLLEQLPKEYSKSVSATTEQQSGTTVFQRIALLEAKENPEAVMRNLGLAGRNALFYWLGNRMRDDNMPRAAQQRYIEAVYSALKDKKDFNFNEAKAAARV